MNLLVFTFNNVLNNFANKSADDSIVLVSSRCGSAANFCIAADGVQVAAGISTGNTNYDNSNTAVSARPKTNAVSAHSVPQPLW